jgi:hypothetical protein
MNVRLAIPFLLAFALGACGGGADRVTGGGPGAVAMPTAVATPTATPGPTSGRIEDLTAARDIVELNQGVSFNTRRVICRWELPVRVYVEPPVAREVVIEALEHWKAYADISYVLVNSPDEEPVVVVREGEVPAPFAGIGGISGTYADNRARRGYVVVKPGFMAPRLHRHEIGHALGFFEHDEPPGLMCDVAGCGGAVTAREGSMMFYLYTLPHGARVATDGSWEVVLRP